MAKIIHFHNPLDKSDRTDYVAGAETFSEWAADKNILRDSPTLVVLNGGELLEKDFDTDLYSDDIVCLMTLPEADPATWALIGSFLVDYGVYIVAAVAALTLPGMLEPDLPIGTTPDDGSTNYSVRQNRARLGKPIPVLYGTMRVYPDLSAASYFEFFNDDQAVYQLFELTQGYAEVDVASAQFEDTLLSNFQDQELEVILPGATSTIFPAQVIVSTEVTGLEILDVALGPYTVNEAASQISYIAWDLSAPQGLYRLTDNGSFRVVQVWFELWAREIDDLGVAVGAWVNYGSHSMSARARDPKNRTYKKAVPLGRYEAKVVRTTPKKNKSNYIDSMSWVGLKGYLPNSDVTNTTRIAVKIRASGQLGNYVLSKFNIKATRRLRSWSTASGWTAEAATNSIAWAFADACSKNYGGNRADAHIDLLGLETLDASFTADGLECNGIFDTKSDLWGALQNIAQTGFCNRIDNAGVYTLVEDSAQVPVAMFGHRNIAKDSFSITHTGVVEESADSVKIEFNDAAQNYRPTTQLCIFDGGPSNNPRLVKLWGVTDQVHAHKIGMWLLAQSSFRRENITFETGIEGKIPFFGDQVAVSHYLIGQSESETIISGEISAFDNIDVLTLTEGVTGLTTPYIILRNKDGSPTTALQCTILTDKTVRVLDAFDTSLLSFGGGFERTHFTMGSGTTSTALVKVVSVESSGKGRLKISGFVDDPAVYDAAAGLAIPNLPPTTTPLDLAPVISNLVGLASGTIDDTIVTLSWDGTHSDKYDVEFSIDAGVTWTDADKGFTLTTGFEHHLDTPPAAVHYRVAGVSLLRGNWTTVIVDTTLTSTLPPSVTGLALASAFIGPSFTVNWDTQAATNWRVEIVKSGTVIYSEDVTTSTITLNNETLVPLGSTRSFDVRVTPITYEGLETTYTSLSISNPQSAAITGITTIGTAGVIGIEWTPPTESDHKAVAIWMSTSPAFTADDTTLVTADAGNKHYSLAINDTATRYFRIAAYDVWGGDSLNVATEFSTSTISGASFKSASGFLYYQTRQTTPPATPTIGSLFTLGASTPYDFDTGVLTTTGTAWEQTPLTVNDSQSNYYYMTFNVTKTGSADEVVTLGAVLLGTQFQNLVTFTSLSTPGVTTIDGGNIKTGTITIGGSLNAKVGGTNLTATNTLNTNTSKTDVGLGSVDNLSAATIRSGTTKSNVGLSLVDNQSAATIQNGTTKAHVGLGNVDNTSDLTTLSGTHTGNVTGTIQGNSSVTVVNSALDPAARINAVATTINGAKISTGTITANQVDTASLQADIVTAGSISGKTITGSIFQTAASGTRVHITTGTSFPSVTAYAGTTKIAELGGNSFGSVYGRAYGIKPGSKFTTTFSTLPAVLAEATSGGPAVEAKATGSGNAVYVTGSGSGNVVAVSSTATNLAIDAVAKNNSLTAHAIRGTSKNGAGTTRAAGVVATAGSWAFLAEAGTAGPFTGSHFIIALPTLDAIIGDIIIDDTIVSRKGINDTVFMGMPSTKINEKGAIGVLSRLGLPLNEEDVPALIEDWDDAEMPGQNKILKAKRKTERKPRFFEKYAEIKDTHHSFVVNALGEGQINVCGEGGDIAKGDLITASMIRGKGMLQSDDLVHNYTVAKAREGATFKSKKAVKMIACIYMCG